MWQWPPVVDVLRGSAERTRSSGGIGTVLGAIIGGVLIGVLNDGMNLMSFDVNLQQVVKGLVLLAAVAFDVYNKEKSGG